MMSLSPQRDQGFVWPGPWLRIPLPLVPGSPSPRPPLLHCTALLVDVVHVACSLSFPPHQSPPTPRQPPSMASAIMASQAVAVAGLGSSLLRTREVHSLRGSLRVAKNSSRQVVLPIRAAKLPQGVAAPKDEPKLPVSFWGFTENAEVWNSRASMIGIFGIIIVEALIHRGILQAIGVDVGKGLNLPL